MPAISWKRATEKFLGGTEFLPILTAGPTQTCYVLEVVDCDLSRLYEGQQCKDGVFLKSW